MLELAVTHKTREALVRTEQHAMRGACISVPHTAF